MIDLALIKYIIIRTITICAFILAFLFVLSKCNSCERKILQLSNNDSLNRVIEVYKVNLKQLDNKLITANEKNYSLIQLKKKVEIKYITSSKNVREELAHGVCDTIKIIETLNNCDSIINLDNKIIAVKDTIISYQTIYISTQKYLISTKDEVISNKDNDIKKLEKEVKKQKRIKVLAVVGTTILAGLTILALH